MLVFNTFCDKFIFRTANKLWTHLRNNDQHLFDFTPRTPVPFKPPDANMSRVRFAGIFKQVTSIGPCYDYIPALYNVYLSLHYYVCNNFGRSISVTSEKYATLFISNTKSPEQKT
ncbi:unnamed protein product [Adineta ricciae]|uniref:Uncharacterized protein n=1 Tax=Adineta ricciae TaxID=249248 RepID=A0A813TI00_ADIRI|nr:unnamed protein product [Adineta ricciae]CAF1380003.1 unnamed protein product [Adineta ricciae]